MILKISFIWNVQFNYYLKKALNQTIFTKIRNKFRGRNTPFRLVNPNARNLILATWLDVPEFVMDIRKTYFNIFYSIKILNRQRTTGCNGANESNYLLTGYSRWPSAASSAYCLLLQCIIPIHYHIQVAPSSVPTCHTK